MRTNPILALSLVVALTALAAGCVKRGSNEPPPMENAPQPPTPMAPAR